MFGKWDKPQNFRELVDPSKGNYERLHERLTEKQIEMYKVIVHASYYQHLNAPALHPVHFYHAPLMDALYNARDRGNPGFLPEKLIQEAIVVGFTQSQTDYQYYREEDQSRKARE